MPNTEYPSFIWSEQRGALFFNAQLPKDYRTRIQGFYQSGGKKYLEELAENVSVSMEDIFGRINIKLQWDNEDGLTGISIDPSGGVYLKKLSFVEHNLGTKTSLMTGAIIINYIKKLLTN